MRTFLIVAAAALFAAACQPLPSDQPSAPTQAPRPAAQTDAAAQASTSETAAACEARGGRLTRVGRLQSVQCVVAYPDAGQRCTDGDECQGSCILEEKDAPPQAGAAAVGRCQAESHRFGCFTTVENGRAEPTLCID